MLVSGQCHALTALRLGKELPVLNETAGCVDLTAGLVDLEEIIMSWPCQESNRDFSRQGRSWGGGGEVDWCCRPGQQGPRGGKMGGKN
jgi:hypothetical protein